MGNRQARESLLVDFALILPSAAVGGVVWALGTGGDLIHDAMFFVIGVFFGAAFVVPVVGLYLFTLTYIPTEWTAPRRRVAALLLAWLNVPLWFVGFLPLTYPFIVRLPVDTSPDSPGDERLLHIPAAADSGSDGFLPTSASAE